MKELAVIHVPPIAIARLTFRRPPCWLEVTNTDVPEYAMVQRVWYNAEWDRFEVLLRSKEFKALPIDAPVPVIQGPTYKTYTGKPGGLA